MAVAHKQVVHKETVQGYQWRYGELILGAEEAAFLNKKLNPKDMW